MKEHLNYRSYGSYFNFIKVEENLRSSSIRPVVEPANETISTLLDLIFGPNNLTNERSRQELISYLENRNGIVSLEGLKKLHIFSDDEAMKIATYFELARRFLLPAKSRIDSALDVYNYLKYRTEMTEENLYVISINGSQEVIKIHHIAKGTLNQVLISPREVFRYAIGDQAAAIIVAHSHPSGNVAPSANDDDINYRLVFAGKMLGIPLIDHIVFSQTAYYSFLENNDANF